MAILSANMNVMIRAAEKAARSLVRDFGEVEQLQVSRKGPGDFVSAADKRAEKIIYEELSKARKDYSFLMEESGSIGDQKSEFRWIIDPLDGTSNFLHGVPHWSISIGLEHNNEIIAGLIYDPVKDEMFRAEKGNGAFMRNRRIRVSGRIDMDSAMIANGRPAVHNKEAVDKFQAQYRAIRDVAPNTRRFGSAALDLSYVAAGRYEGYWEHGIKPWDVAAGVIIVKEAGGFVCGMEKGKDPVHSGGIIAGNSEIHKQMVKILQG